MSSNVVLNQISERTYHLHVSNKNNNEKADAILSVKDLQDLRTKIDKITEKHK